MRACSYPSLPQVIRVRALQSLLDAASDPARALGLTQRGKAAAHDYAVEIVKMEMAPQAPQEGADDGVPSSWRVRSASLDDEGPGAQATDETLVLEAARPARPARPSEPRAAQVAAVAGGGTGSDSSDEEGTMPRQPSG